MEMFLAGHYYGVIWKMRQELKIKQALSVPNRWLPEACQPSANIDQGESN